MCPVPCLSYMACPNGSADATEPSILTGEQERLSHALCLQRESVSHSKAGSPKCFIFHPMRLGFLFSPYNGKILTRLKSKEILLFHPLGPGILFTFLLNSRLSWFMLFGFTLNIFVPRRLFGFTVSLSISNPDLIFILRFSLTFPPYNSNSE